MILSWLQQSSSFSLLSLNQEFNTFVLTVFILSVMVFVGDVGHDVAHQSYYSDVTWGLKCGLQ